MLSPTKSFYAQTLSLLLPFITGVIVIYSLLIQVAINQTEDHLIHHSLDAELERIILQANSATAKVPLNQNAFITTYWESDPKLPSKYASLPVGTYELKDEQHHLRIAEAPQLNQRIYVIFNEDKLSDIEAYEFFLDSGLIILAFILLLVAGGIISVLIAKRLASPLEHLVKELREDWKTDVPLSGSNRKDEIGELSKSIEFYANKLEEVLEREKSFTRHASHEMRTPIGIIKNSLSVIKLPSINEEKRDKNLQRIHNACEDLEQLTNVFLMLGRPRQLISFSSCSIYNLIDSTLSRLDHLLIQQNLNISIQGNRSQQISANTELLHVLITNLIVNAIHHGKESIQIRYDEHQLIVENKVSSPQKHNEGNHGYGLEIIDRICVALGWRFQCSDKDQLFSAKIEFYP